MPILEDQALSEVLPDDSLEAAAAEAAAIGPQLCVILSLADVTRLTVLVTLLPFKLSVSPQGQKARSRRNFGTLLHVRDWATLTVEFISTDHGDWSSPSSFLNTS